MNYRQQYDGDWIRPVLKGYLMRCCQCGSTHRFNFKVIKHGRGHAVMFQVFRHEVRKRVDTSHAEPQRVSTMKITRDSISKVVVGLLETDARKATLFLDDKTVVKATRRHRPDKRAKFTTIALTMGSPNFVERAFIKSCKKAQEPFPVKKLQLKFWPKR